MKYKIKFVLILSCINIYVLYAQKPKVTNDLEGWFGFGLQKEIIRGLELTIEKELRLEKNISNIKRHHTEVGLSYSVFDFLETGGMIRFIEKVKSDKSLTRRYHLAASLTFKKEWMDFKVTYRFKYENEDDDLFRPETQMNNIHVIRNRLKVIYDIPKKPVKPYLESELFYQSGKYVLSEFNEYRITGGIKFSINKVNDFSLYYRIENELNNILPYRIYILGVNYIYDI